MNLLGGLHRCYNWWVNKDDYVEFPIPSDSTMFYASIMCAGSFYQALLREGGNKFYFAEIGRSTTESNSKLSCEVVNNKLRITSLGSWGTYIYLFYSVSINLLVSTLTLDDLSLTHLL